MANNRMLLVHLPTGLACRLGKRMGDGWYMHEESARTVGANIGQLFDEVEFHERCDDFAIALENASGATMATGKWRYGADRDDGLVQLVMEDGSG